MNKRILILMLIPVVLVITGCPTGIAHPLGKPGTEKVDKELIGTWSQPNGEMEILKMEITRIDDFSLRLRVIEKGSAFAEESNIFTGWMTTIDGKKFMYWQEEDNALGNYYTYCFDVKNKVLKTYDITLKVGGVDAVASTETYRQEVSASLKFPDALAGEIVWKRN